MGSLSKELSEIIPKLASHHPIALVVKGDTDGTFKTGDFRIYKVGSSLRTFPHILAYAHALNMDLVRGAANVIHDYKGVSLVHSHDWISSLASLHVSSYVKCPFLISVYTTELTRSNSLRTLLGLGIFDIERFCFQRADRLIVKEDRMHDHLVNDYQIESDKICLGRDHRDILELYKGVTS